uniref:Uncharacterized protein n=1 Tax=Aegilops tauschii subsp. strangulata TaxID=200361 RepID=A0A452XBY4_AEGTS
MLRCSFLNIQQRGRVQMEYVAVFIAGPFPRALVALNYDQLQNLTFFSMLRIYCAGIWHNVMVSNSLIRKCLLKTFIIIIRGMPCSPVEIRCAQI